MGDLWGGGDRRKWRWRIEEETIKISSIREREMCVLDKKRTDERRLASLGRPFFGRERGTGN